ncbi:uncharacterized protein RHO25_010371 [Cercospora beticola]|uniref:Uncharacterized protein n=1 Tax=Cercospora beticola TaxID=122368 RepID=A0ABZ0P204_CERBT|nr:hypothetical protein RHO25_010371 [Cercospora beticola]
MNSPYGAPSQSGASSQYGGSQSQSGAPSQHGGLPQQINMPNFGPQFGGIPQFGPQFGGIPQFGGPLQSGGAPSPFGAPQQGGMQQPSPPDAQGRPREEDTWANMSDQELLANADRIRRKWARSMRRQWRATGANSQEQHMLIAMAEAEFQSDPIRHLRADVYDIHMCRATERLVRRGADPGWAYDLVDRFGAIA